MKYLEEKHNDFWPFLSQTVKLPKITLFCDYSTAVVWGKNYYYMSYSFMFEIIYFASYPWNLFNYYYGVFLKIFLTILN